MRPSSNSGTCSISRRSGIEAFVNRDFDVESSMGYGACGGHPSAAGRDGMNDLLIPVAGLLPLMGAPAQSANRAHLRQRSPTSLRRQHRLALVPRTSTISRASVSVSHPSSSWRRSDYFDAISICKDQRRALLPVRSLSRFINYWK